MLNSLSTFLLQFHSTIVKKYFFKKIICLLCLIMGAGCRNNQPKEVPSKLKNIDHLSVYSADTKPAKDIEFTKEQTFKDTKNALIGRFIDFTVDDEERVYIADGKQLDIKAYRPNGQFLTSLGHKGKGPGEFSNISNVQTAHHRLYAYDNNQRRVVVFSTDSLKYNRTISIAANMSNIEGVRDANSGSYKVKNDGTFFMAFYKSTFPDGRKDWKRVERTSFYYLLGRNGQISSDKILELKSSTRVFVPVSGYTVSRDTGLYPQLLTAISYENRIYTAYSDNFLVKMYTPDGKYKRAFFYPYKKVPLTKKSAFEAGISDFILKGFNLMKLPKDWPVINSMLIDDQNRLWVSTITKDQTVYEWWVLSNKGKLIARFIWPRSRVVQLVKNLKVYALEKKPETNVKSIVRYKFDLTDR